MLSGDNGILQRATDAKTQTGIGQEKEIIALAYNSALAKKISNGNSTAVTAGDLNSELTNQGASAKGNNPITVTFDDSKRQYTINSSGTIEYAGIKSVDDQDKNELPTALGTKPYLPSDKFVQLEGTNLTNGLVITDKAENEEVGNEYVWIEVPNKNMLKTGETIPTGETWPNYPNTLPAEITGELTSEQKTEIETALWAYTGSLITRSTTVNTAPSIDDRKTTTMGWTDEWYDCSGNNESSSTNTSDTTGCGLTLTEYNSKYKAMLKSVYNYGGFWIGRYEAGMTGDTGRADENVSIDGVVPLSKPNLIPIFYVKCSQAQIIATRAQNKGNYNSSLMFGVQWDCVLKYLQNKGVTPSDLTSDSKNWGNNGDTTNATLTDGKYTQYMDSSYQMTFNTWYAYNIDLGEYIQGGVLLKNANMPQGILLTTGASNKFNQKNIYDLAGNMTEWTLEHATSNASYQCSSRGGAYSNTSCPASYRGDWRYDQFELRLSVSVFVFINL